MKKDVFPYNKVEMLNMTDFHVHLGGTTSGHVLWEVAHEQGIKLPTKDYREFVSQMAVKNNIEHKQYLDKFHLTQMIQSSPYAIERSMYYAVSSAYRNANITNLEVRFNPMLRNVDGHYDIDHIILAACIGVSRAMLVYPVKVGIIIEVSRDFSSEKAEILASKAVKFKNSGVVGFDVSGHSPENFKVSTFKKAFEIAEQGGLGLTFHTGEVTSTQEMWEVLEHIKPHRIGHGVACAKDIDLMRELSNKGIILEICPTSNLRLGVLKDIDELHSVITTLRNEGVKFCINSDGPTFLDISVVDEFLMMYSNKILNGEEIEQLVNDSHEYSFSKLLSA